MENNSRTSRPSVRETMIDNEELVHETHPELHHYTNWNGLSGILTSQQLWATHYKHLNDRTEIIQLKNQLTEVLAKRIESFIRELIPTRGFKFRRKLTEVGGIKNLASSEAQHFIGVYYEVTFNGGPSGQPFAEPFITAFCSHKNDDDYVKENGLLSQWRAYGNGGGFALVFDTKGLYPFLEKESNDYEYPTLTFLDVVYESNLSDTEKYFENLITILEGLFRQEIQDNRHDAGLALEPFLNAAVRLKHRAFREEREVRIAACPMSAKFRAYLRQEHPTYSPPNKALKTVQFRESGVPYIELFGFSRQALPIKRIIVGPHADQAAQLSRVKTLAPNIKIVASDTPFISQT